MATRLRKPKKGSNVKIRGNAYWIDFTVQGRRIREPAGTRVLEEAEEIAEQRRKEAKLGKRFKKKPDIELEETLVRYWEEYAKHLKSPQGVWDRLVHFKNFFIKREKLRYLHEIDDEVFHRYILWRKSHYRPNTERFIKDATIEKEVNTFNDMNRNKAQDLWKVNVADVNTKLHKKQLQKSESMANFIPPPQQPVVFEELADHLKDPVRFMLWTGLRWGNIRTFQAHQILWERGQIEFRTKSKLKEGKIIYKPLIKPILELLEWNEITPDTPGDTFVFLQENGLPLGDHSKALRGAFERAGVKLILGQLTHLVRHTAGTNMMMVTENMKKVQEFLGHADMDTSLIYAHLLDGWKNTAMEAAAQIGHNPVNEEELDENSH